jgi:hypothetical protein
MKLPRTLRLDPSDSFVFDRAAEPGEWAVPGGFAFHGADPAALPRKALVAFRSGFLGLSSFGFSTLAEIAECGPTAFAQARAALAAHLVEAHGAPDQATAEAAADDELAFAAAVADLPVGTVIALHRSLEDGEIRERFRSLAPRADRPAPVFALIREDDPEPDAVDLRQLGGLA